MSEEEMENIKATLQHFGQVCCWTRGDPMDETSGRRHLAHQGVLPAVIDWVFS